MRVEREENYFCSDDVQYEKVINVSGDGQNFGELSYSINENFYVEQSETRTIASKRIKDDKLQIALLSNDTEGGTGSEIPAPRTFGEFGHFDQLDSHMTVATKTATSLCIRETALTGLMDDQPPNEVANVDEANSVRPELSVASFMTMENSNNAIDSASIFKERRLSDAGLVTERLNHTFKLPNKELTFNGTLKHLQKLKPIVDTSAATYNAGLEPAEEFSDLRPSSQIEMISEGPLKSIDLSHLSPTVSEKSIKSSTLTSSMSQFATEYCNVEDSIYLHADSSNIASLNTPVESKISSSAEASVPQMICGSTNQTDELNNSRNTSNSRSDAQQGESIHSAVESPDLFYDDEGEEVDIERHPANETDYKEKRITCILKEFEQSDKILARTIEVKLLGVPPPPSVTNVQMNAGDILRLYKANLPIFEKHAEKLLDPEVSNSATTPKRSSVWFQNDTIFQSCPPENVTVSNINEKSDARVSISDVKSTVNTKYNIVNCNKSDAIHRPWPDILQCRYYGIHYNTNDYIEKVELLTLRYIDRYVGAETATSCTSDCSTSPSSTQKRKQRIIPAKSPGRRLSHLARRRQTFCSAATLTDNASVSSKMVLIDRNFFPHRKLTGFQMKKIHTPGKKNIRRTPGKKTPAKKTPRKKTPGKKTPAKKTPRKTPSSSKKTSVRKNVPGSTFVLRSGRETSKRALFVSPEQSAPNTTEAGQRHSQSVSVPARVLKSKRALFGSPETDVSSLMDSNSGDISDSDRKRKRNSEAYDLAPIQKSKLQKSFSFCAELHENNRHGVTLFRRASESQFGLPSKMSELHEKKLIWAVAQALRERSFGRSHPQWRTHASSLRQVVRVLLSLPANAADVANTNKSTSDTMLKLAREYVYFVVNGTALEEIIIQEKQRIASLGKTSRLSVYLTGNSQDVSVCGQPTTGFAQTLARWNSENSHSTIRSHRSADLPGSVAKSILQDKAVNIDANSNSNSSVGSFFSDTASIKSDPLSRDSRVRARRQIKFDNLDDLTR